MHATMFAAYACSTQVVKSVAEVNEPWPASHPGANTVTLCSKSQDLPICNDATDASVFGVNHLSRRTAPAIIIAVTTGNGQIIMQPLFRELSTAFCIRYA